MTIYRLLPNVPGSWGRFEDFRTRIAAFATRHSPDTSIPALLLDAERRWINAPLATGYWIVYGADGKPRAHLYAYIAERLGDPFAMFHQIEAEKSSATQAMAQVATEIRKWIEAVNMAYAAAKSPLRIRHAESTSAIEPRIYCRLFRRTGLMPEPHERIYRWSFEEK